MSSRLPRVRTIDFVVSRQALADVLTPWFHTLGLVRDNEEILTLSTDGGIETQIQVKLTLKRNVEVKYIKLDGT